MGNVLGRWSHIESADADMSLQAYIDRTHRSLPTPGLAFAPSGELTDDLTTYDVDFQDRFLLARRPQHFIWGLGYRRTHDDVTNALALAFLPAGAEPESVQRLRAG